MKLKLKVRSKLPAALVGRTGIAVVKDGLIYDLDLDYSNLVQTSQFDPVNSVFAIWNKFTKQWNTISPASFSSGSFQSITGSSGTVAGGTTLVAIQRASPTATAISLPQVASQAGNAVHLVDWSSSVSQHAITLTPFGSETIMRQSSWSVFSTASQLGSLTLYPSLDLNGWVIAP